MLLRRRDAMFAGEKINTTERRAVLHVALRAPRGSRILLDGVDIVADVHKVLDAMGAFANSLRDGSFTGHTGKRIRNIVNIGIGGSYLGPEMAYRALRPYSERSMRFRFVANVDGAEFQRSHARSGRGGDAVHHLLEDLHHAGDHDQCRHRARLAGGETGV